MKISTIVIKIKNLIDRANRIGGVVVLPFLLYKVILISLEDSNGATWYIYFYAGFYYFLLLLSVWIYLLYQCEKIAEFIDEKMGKLKFILSILRVVLTLSLTFGSYYLCIYIYDPNSFLNVCGANIFERYFNFCYYSLGVFLMNGNSPITPNSIYATLFTSTEMITTFVAIVLILANYKALRDPFNEHVNKQVNSKLNNRE